MEKPTPLKAIADSILKGCRALLGAVRPITRGDSSPSSRLISSGIPPAKRGCKERFWKKKQERAKKVRFGDPDHNIDSSDGVGCNQQRIATKIDPQGRIIAELRVSLQNGSLPRMGSGREGGQKRR